MSNEQIMREALTKLRDCDWVVSWQDRMDAVREIAKLALEQASNSEAAKTCHWVPIDEYDDPNTYEGTCGVAWTFIEGGIEDNEANYCTRCGGKIIQAPTPDKEQ